MVRTPAPLDEKVPQKQALNNALNPALEKWLEQYACALEMRVLPHTRQAYLRDLYRLLSLIEGDPTAWTRATIQHVLIKLHASGLAPRTLHRMLSSWRYFFKYLAEQSPQFEPLLSISVKLPKRPQSLPQTLSPDEAHTILNQAYQLSLPTIEPVDSPSSEQAKIPPCLHAGHVVLAELLYSSGLRIHEAAQLKWQDIDMHQGMIRVLGKGGKMREVPLGRKAHEALLQFKASFSSEPDTSNWIFNTPNGKPLSIRTLQRWIHQLGVKTDTKRPLYPHLFRHSFASHVLQSSGDLRAVQEMLGHASLQATQIYTHLDFQHLSLIYDQAHPRAKQQSQDEKEWPLPRPEESS